MPEKMIKAKLRDIKQNPFRNFDIYPISEDKVRQLIDSIKRLGYWKNIIARGKDGKVEISYGHHRLEALKRIYGRDHKIGIILKDLTACTFPKGFYESRRGLGTDRGLEVGESSGTFFVELNNGFLGHLAPFRNFYLKLTSLHVIFYHP